MYPHTGKNKDNPHYHILILDDKPEKYRKRIKDNLGFTGNKYVSVKLNKNGLLCGIQYCAKEHTDAIVSREEMRDYISQAPLWIQTSIQTVSDSDGRKERDWQLTYTNLVCQAVRYARANNLTDRSLKCVVEELIDKTKWKPSKYLLTGGVPEFYESDFEVRLGKRVKRDMSWWTPRVR